MVQMVNLPHYSTQIFNRLKPLQSYGTSPFILYSRLSSSKTRGNAHLNQIAGGLDYIYNELEPLLKITESVDIYRITSRCVRQRNNIWFLLDHIVKFNKVLIVKELSRLVRNQLDWQLVDKIKELFKKGFIKVWIKSGSYTDDDIDEDIYRFGWESINTIERMKTVPKWVYEDRIKNNLSGYANSGVINRLYQLLGLSYYKIAKTLNMEGYRTLLGGLFQYSSIKSIIANFNKYVV